jgi:proteasome lid subunit RPN8/RPN11
VVSSIIEISEALVEKIETEGVRAYPNECCGIMFGRDIPGDGDFAVRRVVEMLEPVMNEFEEEEQYHRFLITPQTLMRAEKKASEEGLLVLGFYHSHPDAPARPSEYDRQHAWPFYSYVIVSIAKGNPVDMTCWLLDDETNTFKRQEIKET